MLVELVICDKAVRALPETVLTTVLKEAMALLVPVSTCPPVLSKVESETIRLALVLTAEESEA